jgi:glutathione peroxidase
MAMTIRQRILKVVYPLLIKLRQKNTKDKLLRSSAALKPPVSFYSLSATLNNGKTLSFEALKGKKVLLVNTASNCGYTHQYAELQKLYQLAKQNIEIIAFPANDFKEQEKGTDEEIANFCSVNYGVSFPIAKKAVVVKDSSQHPVFQWLSRSGLNGWNDKAPSWNFAKYLVNEEGMLTHYFDPSLSPVGEELRTAIQAQVV